MFIYKNGKFQLDNVRLDGYRLMLWALDRGIKKPSQITEAQARQAVLTDPYIKRPDYEKIA